MAASRTPSDSTPAVGGLPKPAPGRRMRRMKTDVVVLGAGIIGVSAALHLQARGRSVVLLDRRGPGEETSYGNAGLIERASVIPYAFPRDWRSLLRYAGNRTPDVRYHARFLPRDRKSTRLNSSH